VSDDNYDIETGRGDDTLVVDGSVLGTVFLGDGDDAAWGGDLRDVMRGEGGDDSLYGGGGDDVLVDTEGENILFGGEGDDFIRGSSGSTLVGGEGADEFELTLSSNAENPLQVLDYDPETDLLSGIHLLVSDGDTYDVTAVAREAGDGANLMFGDRVLAEVFGASVDDLMDIPVRISLDGGAFTDDETGHLIDGDYFSPETISAGGGDDTVSGGPGDLVDAGDGNDQVAVHGQFSQDVSNPSDMSTVQGGLGDDIILSSNGNELAGGEGADIFGLSLTQYNAAGTGAGFDLTESVITDFNPAEDVIYIESGFITQEGGRADEPEATLSIEVWTDGLGADILAGDQVIARVTGGQSLRVADLMIAQSLESSLLGSH
jgi:Ca2+-binding RTX toxin-like protein